MSSVQKRKIPPIPAILLSMISVQGGASLAKSLFPVLGPAGTTVLRVGFAAVVLILLLRVNLFRLTRQQWLYSLVFGLCLGAMNLVFYFAIERIPLGLGVSIEFLGPLTLAIIGSRKLLDLLWVVLAAGGIALIAPWRISDNIDPIGVLLAAAAGSLWAGYIVFGGRIAKIMDSSDAVAVGLLFSTALVLPFGLLSGDLAALDGRLLLVGLGMALLTSAIPYTLEMSALSQLPPKTFSILMSLHPAFAALSGLIFLQEHLNYLQWLSIICVIAASAGATAFSKR